MKKLIKLKYKKERCLLSEVLPYEVPLIFKNTHFYKFIIKHKIEYSREKKKITWINRNSNALDTLIQILFNLHDTTNFSREGNICIYKTDQQLFEYTIPYSFKITHPTNVFRELSIPHPLSQLIIIDFYNQHKEQILYYCSLSDFSIRKPTRITQYLYHKDKMHYNRLAIDSEDLELTGEEYKNLRSFFVYKQYSHIHSFYESELFNECEKKYDHLVKLDISKCFDSIYTHSIAWATLGITQTKDAVKHSKSTFGGQFDKLMQGINYNETNGIIIGPELSRIFAEIILQSIDRNIKNDLLQKHNLKNNKDYQIYRYIDDYFIFFNTKNSREIIINVVQNNIKKYKLNLNTSKIVDYNKPIITEISIAKTKISSLIDEQLKFNLTQIENEQITIDNKEETVFKGNIYINSTKLIKDFKIIIKESNVEYRSILNYTLTAIGRKFYYIIKDYSKILNEYRNQDTLIIALKNMLKFIFFIYTVAPQISTTIRLCRVIGDILYFIKKNNIHQENRNIIEQCLFENICLILNKNRINQYTQLETIYLILVLKELNEDYSLSEDTLALYLNIELDDDKKLSNANYFFYISVLFYIKNKTCYKTIHQKIISSIKENINLKTKNIKRDSELTMFIMDILSCPYILDNDKAEILQKTYNITDASLLREMCNYKEGKKIQLWFTTWTRFNFLQELYDKQSKEVY